ncbi:MAG: ABC transporter permease, partial [Deltaproteobacteria bacterium]|nr:ABC transporter permease [Deltaproteobacteria bacterium]
EVLAWGIAFLFQPVSAVFYPVSVLPEWLRAVASFIPASYVFEGMREVIFSVKFDANKLFFALGLNALYLISALLFFFLMFRTVRERGLLSKTGE